MSSRQAGQVLSVGASLAGATVAGQVREVGLLGQITLLGAEDALPYERPALNETYLTGQVDAAALRIHDPAFSPITPSPCGLGNRRSTGTPSGGSSGGGPRRSHEPARRVRRR